MWFARVHGCPDNCPRGKLPPPDNFPLDNCLLDDFPLTITFLSKIIAPTQANSP